MKGWPDMPSWWGMGGSDGFTVRYLFTEKTVCMYWFC